MTSSTLAPGANQTHSDLVELYSSQDLSLKKRWYSQSAKAYDECRPKYPDEIMDQIAAYITESPNINDSDTSNRNSARVLEIGCGPGTSTTSLAKRGFHLVCVEPNADFCALARENTLPYASQVSAIVNEPFEDFEASNHVDDVLFDAVVAATCMHWVSEEIRFPKAASSLREGGTLIMLWNMTLNPVHKSNLEQLQIAHDEVDCSTLLVWSDEDKSIKGIQSIGDSMIESGLFENLIVNEARTFATYSTQRYLGLLSTYSPYIRLEPGVRASLFGRIEKLIDDTMGGQLELSHITLSQMATKKNA